jgi:hypothetical protein
MVKRILRWYEFPPDKEEKVALIVKDGLVRSSAQADLLFTATIKMSAARMRGILTTVKHIL